jgi:hypothetical protein
MLCKGTIIIKNTILPINYLIKLAKNITDFG